MSTLYIYTNPDAPEGFGEFDEEPESHLMFTDDQVYESIKRRDKEREIASMTISAEDIINQSGMFEPAGEENGIKVFNLKL